MRCADKSSNARIRKKSLYRGICFYRIYSHVSPDRIALQKSFAYQWKGNFIVLSILIFSLGVSSLLLSLSAFPLFWLAHCFECHSQRLYLMRQIGIENQLPKPKTLKM